MKDTSKSLLTAQVAQFLYELPTIVRVLVPICVHVYECACVCERLNGLLLKSPLTLLRA